MKIRTSELIGPALDWAVAQCLGKQTLIDHYGAIFIESPGTDSGEYYGWTRFEPHTNWSHGGPIIEHEVIELYEHKQLECWAAKSKAGDLRYGPTPLIAAMRCDLASKLGDEVEVPEELTHG